MAACAPAIRIGWPDSARDGFERQHLKYDLSTVKKPATAPGRIRARLINRFENTAGDIDGEPDNIGAELFRHCKKVEKCQKLLP